MTLLKFAAERRAAAAAAAVDDRYLMHCRPTAANPAQRRLMMGQTDRQTGGQRTVT